MKPLGKLGAMAVMMAAAMSDSSSPVDGDVSSSPRGWGRKYPLTKKQLKARAATKRQRKARQKQR